MSFKKNEINKEIKELKNENKTWKIDRKDSIYETIKYTLNFQQSETIKSLVDSIFNGKITLVKVIQTKAT